MFAIIIFSFPVNVNLHLDYIITTTMNKICHLTQAKVFCLISIFGPL